jgi:hypothetical protein
MVVSTGQMRVSATGYAILARNASSGCARDRSGDSEWPLERKTAAAPEAATDTADTTM